MAMKTAEKFNQNRRLTASLFLASVGLILTGCGANTADSGTDVALAGSLTSAGTTAKTTRNLSFKGIDTAANKAQSFTGDSVVCATLTNPPVTATATVATDGSFSISIAGGVNQPMNCNLVDSTGAILAAIVTSDSTHTDMKKNPTTQSTVAYTASANLGTITYDSTTGKASIPVENIKSSVAPPPVAANVYDPTGEWTIAAYPTKLPKGYSDLCPTNSQNCNGPPAGQLLYLKQYKGTQATDTTASVFGLQIWQGGKAARDACGANVGMTHAEAVAVGVDFSLTGVEGSFTYDTSVTVSGTSRALTNNYQITGATSVYPTQLGCGSKTITIAGVSQIGWVCTGLARDGTTTLYQASVGGGCSSKATGKPVQVNGSFTPDGNACTTVDVGSGYAIQTCGGTYNGTPITCTNEQGTFSNAALTASVTVTNSTSTQFDFSSLTQIASGTSCGDNRFSALQQAQCYANYFQQNVGDHSTACLKRLNTDWSASTVADFLQLGNNPASLVAFNEFHPDPSGKGGAMRMEQSQIQGIQAASGNGYTACKTFEVDEFSYKKIDDKTLLTTYQATTITTDTGKPDCVAKFGSAGNGSVQKFLFLLKK